MADAPTFADFVFIVLTAKLEMAANPHTTRAARDDRTTPPLRNQAAAG